jgi:hypothetical protein
MKQHLSLRRRLPSGQVVAGVAVAIGLVSAVGLLMSGDGPDLLAHGGAAFGACSVWPIPSAAL